MEPPELDDLTSDQLGEFRRTYIRDDWDGTRGLSRYNSSNKARFFEDDDLRLMEQRIRSDKLEELGACWIDRNAERIREGDSADAAAIQAGLTQLEARFRFLRAECLRRMRIDPAMRASLIVGDKAAMAEKVMEAWAAQIEEDEEWAISRSGEWASIRVERM